MQEFCATGFNIKQLILTLHQLEIDSACFMAGRQTHQNM